LSELIKTRKYRCPSLAGTIALVVSLVAVIGPP